MKRFFVVFGVAVCFGSFVFADSTNIVGGGSVDLSGFLFSGSGDYPTNYAANVENATDLQISGSSFDGGVGGISTGSVSSINEDGGTGLRLSDVGLATITNSTFNGGIGGSITSQVCQLPEANGGHGIKSMGGFDVALEDGTVAEGGYAGSVETENGQAKVFGGDALHFEIQPISGSMVIFNGSYQGGNGGSANYNSGKKEENIIQIINGDLNGVRGGHGVYVFQSDMYREATRSVRIEDGVFMGGSGGVATNQQVVGDVFADGGSGILIGSVSDVEIHGGTFSGGVAGIANGVAGKGGFGATFWDSNVEISGGNFQGDDGGLFFGSLYYESIISISGGYFSNVEISSIDGRYLGNTIIDVSGGEMGDIAFSGDNAIDATFSGGTVGNIHFGGTGSIQISATGSTLWGTAFSQESGEVYSASNLMAGATYSLNGGRLVVANGLPMGVGAVDFDSSGNGKLSVPSAG